MAVGYRRARRASAAARRGLRAWRRRERWRDRVWRCCMRGCSCNCSRHCGRGRRCNRSCGRISTPLSLVIGAGGAFLVSVLTVVWAVFSLGRVAPSALLAGQMPGEGDETRPAPAALELVDRRSLARGRLRTCSLLGTGRGPRDAGHDIFRQRQSAAHRLPGGAVGWMRSTRSRTVEGHGLWSVARLGIRNAARHPGRSLLTAGLLASAAFLHRRRRGVSPPRRCARGRRAGQRRFRSAGRIGPAAVPRSEQRGRPREVSDKLVPIYRDESGGDNARPNGAARRRRPCSSR